MEATVKLKEQLATIQVQVINFCNEYAHHDLVQLFHITSEVKNQERC
jgi:hypothetical protein